ncbi:hypothetical protein E1264_24005 [Actinomadura sp. KC216]|uniref:hypothetical protein n=1 Tax=Actinomadura sp. KC216 TaxID=2530370 RepID=UPI0010534D07|nr:hypothetical protein [Actinomadura sp. KC216]TDB84642.1 hypothetical protein E1264_24005 [Actinomadura sp. KC216]
MDSTRFAYLLIDQLTARREINLGVVRLPGLQPLGRHVIRQTKLDERIPVHRDATAALHSALTGMPVVGRNCNRLRFWLAGSPE